MKTPSVRKRWTAGVVVFILLAGLVAAWLTPGALRVYHPVDPARVCIDNSGEVYRGVYNLSPDEENPDPFKWQCYEMEAGDLTEKKGELNISLWCESEYGTPHTDVRDGQWFCVDVRLLPSV